MVQQPHWNSHCGPPRIEQDGGFELELLGRQLAVSYPNVPPRPGPASAHGDISAPGYGQHVSHDSSAGTIESGPFNTSSAFGSAHPAGFSMQPSPTFNSVWSPTSSSPPPPPDWQAPNMDSFLNPQSFIAAHTAALGQGTPILLSLPGFRPLFNPIGTSTYPGQAFGMTSNTAPEAPQQPHPPVASQPTPGPSAFWRRHWQRFRRSIPQDTEACWRCKGSHKKCDGGTPCLRCGKYPGNSAIPCCYGPVCDAAAEIPFLCHMPRGASSLQAELLPPNLQSAASLLSRARRRKCHAVSRVKRPEYVVGSNDSIFCRVVNIEVPNIRVFVNPLEPRLVEMHLLNPANPPQHGLPYDDLIVSIVWEFEDNPAAQLTGVGAVEDLVALLEAACLCEAQWGPRDHTRRLVYSSMRCLLHCMEALRLSADGLLAVDADAHAHCAQAHECRYPAFHGITKYAIRYAEALTMALFHKKRNRNNNWLLAFYSLCIQGYVRRALMSLEEHLRSVELSAGGMEVEGGARRLCTANYLQTAVFLFGKFSMQGKGKLAKSIQDERPDSSVYLQKPPHSSQAGDHSSSSWQQWCDEGVPEFLGRIYQIPIDDSTSYYQPRHTEPPRTGADSDSEGTIIVPSQSQPPPSATTVFPPQSQPLPSGTVTAAATAMAQSTAEMAQAGFSVSNTDANCWAFSSPASTPEPSILGSTWSETSYEEGSDTSTFYAASLSTVTMDDYTPEDGFGFEAWGGSVLEHYAEENGDAFMDGYQNE